MARARTIGMGWHKESLRHSQARRLGKASPRIKKILTKHPSYKNLTYKGLQKKGVFLRYQSDSDKDGVPNIHDCRPLNKKAQDNGEQLEPEHKNWLQRWREAREEKEKHKLIEEAKELKKTRDERIRIEGRNKIHKLLREEKEKLQKAKETESQQKNEQRQKTIRKIKEFLDYKPAHKKKTRKQKEERIFPTLKEIYG